MKTKAISTLKGGVLKWRPMAAKGVWNMNFNQYTKKSLEAVQSAQSLAVEHHHQQMEQLHLLLALLQQEGGLAPQILRKLGVTVESLEAAPFTMLILGNFLSEIPVSMDEAAEIDGANMFQKLFYITLPLMKPAIATILIINFINCLNDLFTPLFFAQKIEVLSVAITTIPRETSYSMPWDLISTVGCVILLPIVIFVLIFEKQIMEGVMAGGVKQ